MDIEIVKEKVTNENTATYRLALPIAQKNTAETYEPMRIVSNEQESAPAVQMNNEAEEALQMYQRKKCIDMQRRLYENNEQSMIRLNEAVKRKALDIEADERRRRNHERLRCKREGEYSIVEISPSGVPLIKNRNAYDEEMVHEFVDLTFPKLCKIYSTNLLTKEKYVIWRLSYHTKQRYTEIYISDENLCKTDYIVRCLKESGVKIKAKNKQKRIEKVALLISELLAQKEEIEIPYSTGWYCAEQKYLAYAEKVEKTWRGLVEGKAANYPVHETSIVNDFQTLLEWLSTPVALMVFQALYRVPFELKEHCKPAGIILTVENRRMANVFLDYLKSLFPNVIRLRKNSREYVPNDGIGILLYNSEMKGLEIEKFLLESEFFPVLLVDNRRSLDNVIRECMVPVLNISEEDCALFQDKAYVGTLLTIRQKSIAGHWVEHKILEGTQTGKPWEMESFWQHQSIILSELLHFLLNNEDEYHKGMKYMKKVFEEKTEIYYVAASDSQDITETFIELFEKADLQQKGRDNITWEELERNEETIICTPTDFWLTPGCLKKIIHPVVAVMSERTIKRALAETGVLKSEKSDFTKKLTLKESPNNLIAVRRRMINLDRTCVETLLVPEEERR